MGIAFGGKGGIVSDPNIVPLIDILLVLLVIFMLFPHSSWGLQAQIPHECGSLGAESCSGGDKPTAVVIQVLANGSLRVNQESVQWENLDARLREFLGGADRTAFIWGDPSVEFAVVARVIDVMHATGIASIGLLTQQPDL